MREKNAGGLKSCKILIRVSEKEKKDVERMSRKNGENMSEFFRGMIKEKKNSEKTDAIMSIIHEMEQLLLSQKTNLEIINGAIGRNISQGPPQTFG